MSSANSPKNLNKYDRYLFLLAWAEGSDSACGDLTKVTAQSDLMPQYLAGNQYIFAVEIRVPSQYYSKILAEEIAHNYGYAEAWRNGYTNRDSVSCLEVISVWLNFAGDFKLRPETPVITID